MCTRASAGRATARIALDGRTVPTVVEALLDDIDVGELEGRTIDEYRAWKRGHTRTDPFGGESLDDAARRYATAYERLLERRERRVLVVCHEIPVINAAAGSDEPDGPAHELGNCIPSLRRGRARPRGGRIAFSPPDVRRPARPPVLPDAVQPALHVRVHRRRDHEVEHEGRASR